MVCHLIGKPLAVPVDVELLAPGEGEVPAAMRLLERVFENDARFFDVIVVDGLYFQAPFVNFCLAHRKDVVAVLKGEHRLLRQDAEGLFATMPPGVWQTPGQTIHFWDTEGFTSAEGIAVPLRVLHSQETRPRRQRRGGRWIEVTDRQDWWWATTLPADRVPTRTLWEIAHGRWEIENELFNTLVTHWSLNHCYKHDPPAIVNFILTLFIVFVLLQCFYHRNLKPPRRAYLSLIAVAWQLYIGLAAPDLQAPWIACLARPPP